MTNANSHENQCKNHALRVFANFRVCMILLCVTIATPLHAQFEYAESFDSTTAVGWNFVTGGEGAGPSLTAATGVDADGSGWLRLANNTANEANAVWLNTAIPSSNNTIQVSFDIAMYGNSTNPGDGIGFFLWDASVPFTTGAAGGSFAYAQKTTTNGMSNGYIGVALDVYGNYSSESEGRVGGLGKSLYKDTVGVRGPGNGTTGYEYINSTVSTYTPYSLDFANLTTRPDQNTQYRHVRITLDSNDLLIVEIQFGENGLWTTVFSQDISSLGLRPDQLRMGYSASSGDATEFYEIHNLSITATGTGDSSYWDNGAGTSIWNADPANSPNWNPDFTPSDRANIVFNDSYVATDQNIMLMGTRTASSIFFSGTYSYQLNTTATNNGLLVLDTGISTKSAVIAVTNSPNGNRDQSLNVPIELHNNLTINNYVDQTLTLGGTITMGSNSITNRGNGTTVMTSTLSGTGGVTENGATGHLILAGNNTYTGLTTVSAGTLIAASSKALGSTASGTVVYSGGTLALSNSGSITNEALTVYAGNGDSSQGQIRNISGTNTWSGAVSLTNSSTVSAPVVMAADAGSTLNITGVISGNTLSGVNKTGSGTIVFSGNNTYNGPTTISGGILQIGADSGLGTAPGSATAGQLTFNGGTLAVTANTVLNSNRGIQLNTLGGTIQVSSGTNTTYAGIVAGNGDISKTGDGTLLLTGSNSYTGATNINAGTLITSGGSSISNTGSVNIANVAGTNWVLSSSETIGSVSGGGATGGNINLNGNTLTTGGNNASTTFAGVISGSGGVTKTGTGTLVLEGSNTYTGATTVTAGTLALGNNNVLSNTSSLILNGGTLAVNGHTDTVGTLTLSSSSTIDFGSMTSQFTLSAATTPTSTTSILLIDNWTGSIAGGSGSQLFLTSTSTASLSLLSQIQFEGYAQGATRLDSGEVVPAVIANGSYWNNAQPYWNSTLSTWNNGAGTPQAVYPNGIDKLAVFGKLNSAGANSTNTNSKTVTLTGSATVGYVVFNSSIATENYTIAATGTNSLIFQVSGTNSAYINMNSTASNLISAPIALSSSLNISQNGTGTLTLSGPITTNNKNIAVDGSGKTVISGAFGGTTTLTKSGTGTLTLSGANSHTGGTVINGGIVSVTSSANLGANTTSNALTFNGGTLATTGTFSRSSNIILKSGGGTIDVANGTILTTAGAYSGSGDFTKTGSGSLVITGTSTATGTVYINGGLLISSSSNAIGDTSAVNIANVAGAALVLTNSGETIGSLSGGGATGGNLNLNIYVLTTGGNNASTTYDGLISGTGGGITKTGTGSFILTNNSNSYTGTTTVSAGELVMANSGALGTGTVNVANGAMLSLSNSSGINAASGKTLTLSGTGIANQGALNNELGNNTWAGAVTLAGNSSIGLNGGNLTLSGPVNGGTNTLTVSGNFDGAITGTISGLSGGLIKTGNGTLTLSGNNSYTGTTTVNTGSLAITSNNALGATTNGTIVANGASLALSNNITVSTETLTISGLGINYGDTNSGVIQSNGNNTLTGNVTMSLEPGINVNSGTLTMSGTLSGTSGMSKEGTGTLVLSGNNTYNGAVSVNSGILSVQSNNALGTASTSVRTTINDGATVQIGTASSALSVAESFTINGAGVGGNGVIANTGGNNSISGLISLGANSTIGVTNSSTLSATGVISGSHDLTKVGAGTLVLTGTNTYTGSTNINGGTVVVSSDANLGTAVAVPTVDQLTFNNGTLQTASAFTLDSDRGITLNSGGGTINLTTTSATISYGGIVGGAGNLTVSGSGTLVLSNTNNNYLGTTTVNGATLAIAGDGSLGTAPVSALSNSITLNGGTLSTSNSTTINANRGMTLDGTGGTINISSSAATVTYAGAATGTGGLTVNGSGTLILTGTNSYTGVTTVTGGSTLSLGRDNVIGDSSSLILNNSTLATNGNNDKMGTLTLSGNNTIDMGGIDAVSAITFSGIVSTTTSNLLTITNWTGNIDGGSGSQIYSTSALNGTTTSSIQFADFAIGVKQLSSGELVPLLAGTYWNNSNSAGLWSTNGNWNPNTNNPRTRGALAVFGTTTSSGTANTNTPKTVYISSSGPQATRTVGYLLFNSENANESFTITGSNSSSRLILDVSTGSALINVSALTASNTISVNLSLSDSTIIRNNGGGTLNIASTITTGNNDITVDGTGKTIISGTFGGTTTLTKSNTGTLTLSGTNTYTGSTVINGGILSVTSSANLGTNTATNSIIFNGGTLATTGTFSRSSNIILNSGGGTIDVATGTTLTTSGVYSGTGDFTKAGAGTLIVTATNTYTGDTYITGGNLVTSGGSSISNTSSVILSNVSGAVWTLSSSETIGTLQGGGTTGGNVNLNNNTLNVGGTNANFTYSGSISGTGGITKTGTGTMVLAGTNSYSGDTNITAGTLMLGASNALNNGTNVTMASGTTLGLGGGTQQTNVGTLTLTGNSTIDMGAGVGTRIEFTDTATNWGSNILSITNYDPNADNDYLYFGSNYSGLSSADLGNIRFIDPVGYAPGSYYARILADGRVVPIVPEPSTIVGGILLVLWVLWRIYRKRRTAAA